MSELGDYYGQSQNDGSRIQLDEAAHNIRHWWGSQDDPLYAIATQFSRRERPNDSDLEAGLSNLRAYRDSSHLSDEETDELEDLISIFEDILGAAADRDPEVVDESLDQDLYPVHFEALHEDYPHRDRLTAIVRGERANEWADEHTTIDGDTLEESGPEEVYAIVDNTVHAGGPSAGVDPIDRWRAEGYDLNLSGHEDFNPDCASVGCLDRQCPWRHPAKIRRHAR